MAVINIHDAKTHFSKLIHRVLNGEEVIIAKGGKPLIRLMPYVDKPQERMGGQLKGIIEISPEFDSPLPESLMQQFYSDDQE